jgi:hypothetical protein
MFRRYLVANPRNINRQKTEKIRISPSTYSWYVINSDLKHKVAKENNSGGELKTERLRGPFAIGKRSE